MLPEMMVVEEVQRKTRTRTRSTAGIWHRILERTGKKEQSSSDSVFLGSRDLFLDNEVTAISVSSELCSWFSRHGGCIFSRKIWCLDMEARRESE